MEAIKVAEGGTAELRRVALPRLRNDCIIVKVEAVALNPADWKHIQMAVPGATVVCDYAGYVVDVGLAVRSPLVKGDRVAGVTHGNNAGNIEDGCFAEYCVAKDGLQMRIPDDMSFEQAATLGLGITTMSQGLYTSLRLPLPTQPAQTPFPILIHGGSTATGSLAIQFAKLSGLTVVTTCSPHNFDYVLSLGADVVYDYRDPACAEKIRNSTQDSLEYVFDCVSEGQSPVLCANSISSRGGAISFLLLTASPREDVESRRTIAYSVFGEEFPFGSLRIPAKSDDFKFGQEFWRLAEVIFREGRAKVHRHEVRGGGLRGIFGGLQDLRESKVSGMKLVYVIGSRG
ncbi:GroES-like protein, partial [Aureobasidium melanogenum]